MGAPQTSIAPARLTGVDLARAVAIAGMIIAHYVLRAREPGVLDAVRAFVDGRAMPLFVVLFGVSISLLAQRTRHPDRALAVRAAVFLPLGLLVQEWTVGIAIILHYYALFAVLTIGLRRLGDKALLIGAALVAAAPIVTAQLVGPRWPGYIEWDGGRGIAPPWGLLANLTVNGTYPALPSLAFVMIGLWLGRRPLADVRVAARLVVVGIALGLVGYVGGRAIGDRVGATGVTIDDTGTPQLVADRRAEVLRAFGYKQYQLDEISPDDPPARRQAYESLVRYAEGRVPAFHAARIFDASGHSEMPAWTLGATGTACAVLGLCLLVARAVPRGLGALVAAGQLSLTIYVVQAIVIRWTPAAGSSTIAHQMARATLLTAACTAFAWLWRRRFRRGPLEQLLHVLARP